MTLPDPDPTPQTQPLWMDPDVIQELFPSLTPEQAVDIVAEATWVLDQLTNGYYHGVECWREVFEVRGCVMALTRAPILSIDSVQQLHSCDTVSTDMSYCRITEHKISICPSDCGNSIGNAAFDYRRNSCGCPKRIAVTYTIGDNLPPGALAAVLNLASEYANALCGKKCNLPERVTSIVRQGVSWVLLDPQDFIDKGLVGISRIDSWISIANRNVSRGRAYDPLNLGIRIWSTNLGFAACSELEPAP